jgi:hypothetical protein
LPELQWHLVAYLSSVTHCYYNVGLLRKVN